MEGIKKEIVDMLNDALKLEHAMRIQYLAHAQMVDGLNSESLVARLEELADDEKKHEDIFRELIGSYLYSEPTMGMSETKHAYEINDILNTNLGMEKHAIDFYKEIYRKIVDNKQQLWYEFEKLEHDLRHVIIDELEHVSEINQLLGNKEQ